MPPGLLRTISHFSRCMARAPRRATRSKPPRSDTLWDRVGRFRCPIGSVKTNIGHLEPASGMAGLLKAALALDRELIPPTIHCEKPNPKIPFEALNLRLVRKIEPAKAPERPYAGVNSFGFGGTNAHVVLARADPMPGSARSRAAASPGHLGTNRNIAAIARSELAHRACHGSAGARTDAVAGRCPRARPSSAATDRALAG